MKTLIIILAVMSVNTYAKCTLNLKVQGDIYYLDTGDALDENTVIKIASFCKLKIDKLTEKHIIEFAVQTLERRLKYQRRKLEIELKQPINKAEML